MAPAPVHTYKFRFLELRKVAQQLSMIKALGSTGREKPIWGQGVYVCEFGICGLWACDFIPSS